MDIREQKHRHKEFGRHPWETVRARLICRLFKQLQRQDYVQEVLDIGCGDGYIAKVFLQRYPSLTVHAVDNALTRDQRQKLEQGFAKGRLTAHKALEEVGSQHNVGAVMLLDVLEHIQDEKAFLMHIKDLPSVQDNAVFLITVPAFSFLFGQHDRSFGHYRRYNIRQLKRVLGECGFDIEQTGYFFFSLLLPRMVQVLWDKITGSQKESKGVGAWKARKVRDKIIRAVLRFDCQLGLMFRKIGLYLPGTSVYCVARIKKKTSP